MKKTILNPIYLLFALLSLTSFSVFAIPTVITTQPSLVDPDLCPGDAFTLQVKANGDNLMYQWQKDGVDISGEVFTSYIINSASAVDAGTYSVVVTGDDGTETSIPVTITVGSSTTIDIQPLDASACEQSNVSFGVIASGDNLTYQWKKDGTNIFGATSSVLVIDPASISDAGDYSVEVTGNCGRVLSNVAELSVTATEFPSVGLIVDKETICQGNGAIFTANGIATGTFPTYEFRDADNPINILQASSSSNTYSRTDILSDINVEVVMTSNSVCIDQSASNPVTATTNVQVIEAPVAIVTNPTFLPDTIFVAEDSYNGLNVVDPGAGYTVTWEKINPLQQGTIVSPIAVTTNITGLTTIEPDPMTGVGTTDMRVIVQDVENVCPASEDHITIVRKGITEPELKDAEICITELPYTIQGNSVIPGIETPFIVDEDDATGNGVNFMYAAINSIEITNQALPAFTGNSKDFRFEYRIDNAVSGTTLSDDMILTIYKTTSIANAGNDIITCAESVNLDANVPTIGSGQWVCDAGTLADPTDPKTQLLGLVEGQSITCTWTTTNGVCASTSDDVVIYRQPEITTPSIYLDGEEVTGMNIELCVTDQVTLSGATPAGQETGQWRIVSGTAVTGVTGSSPDQGVLTIASSGQSILEWLISPSIPNCPAEVRTLELIVHAVPVANILSISSTDTCVGADISIETEAVGPTDFFDWTSDIIPGNPSADTWLIDAFDLSVGENIITYQVENNGCDPVTVSETINVSAGPEIIIQNLVNGEIVSNSINNIALEATHTGSISNWSSPEGDFITIDNPNSAATNASIEWNRVVPIQFTASDGRCEASKIVNIRTNDPVGLDQVVTSSGNSLFSINGLENYDDVQLSIYNLEGKLITQDPLNDQTTWVASALSSGLYIYKLTYDNQSQVVSGKIQVID